MYPASRSLLAPLLLASLAVACSGGGSDTDDSTTSATDTATATGGSATVTSTTATDGTGTSSGETSGGIAGQAGYFRLQSFGSSIQLLGNFLDVYTDGGGTTLGLCTKIGISTGLVHAGGTMTVKRGAEVLLVADLPGAPVASATLVAGDALSFEGAPPDGILSDFSAGPLVVPSAPTDVVGPDTITVGEPVTISWTPPADPLGDVLVELVQSQAGIDKIQCVVPVSAGSVTIDAGLLTHLVPSDADNPNVQMAVSPFAELIAEVDGKAVEFEFLAALTVFGAPVVAG